MKTRYRTLQIAATCIVIASALVYWAARHSPPRDVHRDVAPASDSTKNAVPVASVRVSTPADVRLSDPSTSISGIVTDTKGNVLADAKVALKPFNEYARLKHLILREVVTHSDGSFEFTGLPEDTFEIEAARGKYHSSETRRVHTGEREITLVLVDMAIISGTVRNARTDMPITAFEVLAVWKQGLMSRDEIALLESWTAISDPEGRFACDGIDYERLHIVAVRAEGYAMEFVEVPEIEAGKDRDDVVIRLQPGFEVQGVVVNEEGVPIGGAKVAAATEQESRDHKGTETDAEGRFSLKTLSPEDKFLSATHPDYIPADVPISPAPGVTPSVTITLETGAIIQGVVSYGGNLQVETEVTVSPEKEANAHATDGSRSMRKHFEIRTDEQGRYEARPVRAGLTYVGAGIKIESEDDDSSGLEEEHSHTENPYRIYIERSVMAKNGEVTQVDFEIPANLAVLEGTVELDGQPPIPNSVIIARLDVSGPLGRTGGMMPVSPKGTGQFAFDNLLPGVGEIRFDWKRHGSTWFSKTVNIEIAEGEVNRRAFSFHLGPTLYVRLIGLRDSENVVLVDVYDDTVSPAEIRGERDRERDNERRTLHQVTRSDDLDGDTIEVKGLEHGKKYTLAAMATSVPEFTEWYKSPYAFDSSIVELEPRIAAMSITTGSDEEMSVEIALPDAE